MIYTLILAFVIVLVIFHIKTRYSRAGKLLLQIPGPKPYPIFENLLMFNISPTEIWMLLRKLHKEYYPITRYLLNNINIVSIFHPDDLQILFLSTKVIEKGYAYDYMQAWFKTGLLTSTGEKWHRRRKLLTPTFHFSILKKYKEIIREVGEKFVESFKTSENEIIVDLENVCSKCTLDIICESAMGVNLDKTDDETVKKYKKAVHDFGDIVLYRLCRPYVQNWMMPFIRVGWIQRNAIKILRQFTTKIVEDRKAFHLQTENKYLINNLDQMEGETNSHTGKKMRLAMLDVLLAAQQDGLIDDEGILEEVDTFTFAGHDTTATGLTYTLMLFAENKEAQDRARAEVTKIMGNNNGKMIMSHLQELIYLERCIKESMRLFPPVSTILRYAEKDLQLKHALVPAGTNILINMFDTHRDPNFWTEPNKFDPDRFLPEFTKDRHPYAYVPFSAGPRNCIGQKFAMLELKCLVAQVLYNYYLEPIDRTSDIELIADLVIRPSKPVYIKFIRINK